MQILNELAFSRKPSAVLFDLDNTLYAYGEAHTAGMEAVIAKACVLWGATPNTFEEAFRQARQEVKAALRKSASSHSRLLYFQRTIETLGMKTRVKQALDLEQTYWRSFMMAATLRPGSIDFLMDVRASGAATVAVTNLTAQIQFRKLVFFNIDGLFDYVVTSEEAGEDKPGAAPFLLAKVKLQLPEDACIWMVGDEAADLAAREIIGAVTLLLRPEPGERVQGEPDMWFNDFSDLRKLIGRFL